MQYASDRRRRRWIWLAVCAALAGGCAQVKPWEKQRLSRRTMQPDADAANKMFENKVFSVMEAAGGGEADAVGGGCGCN